MVNLNARFQTSVVDFGVDFGASFALGFAMYG